VDGVVDLLTPGGGLVKGLLSEPVREFVRDIDKLGRSLLASRSLARRSATSCSLDVTSTGRAVPNGFGRGVEPDGPVLEGELGAPPDRGSNSNFRRPN
jgi:hypothetical protein